MNSFVKGALSASSVTVHLLLYGAIRPTYLPVTDIYYKRYETDYIEDMILANDIRGVQYGRKTRPMPELFRWLHTNCPAVYDNLSIYDNMSVADNIYAPNHSTFNPVTHYDVYESLALYLKHDFIFKHLFLTYPNRSRFSTRYTSRSFDSLKLVFFAGQTKIPSTASMNKHMAFVGAIYCNLGVIKWIHAISGYVSKMVRESAGRYQNYSILDWLAEQQCITDGIIPPRPGYFR